MQVNWLEEFKVSAKQSGVLAPFLKFPSFVERMESVMVTHAANTDLGATSSTTIADANLGRLLPTPLAVASSPTSSITASVRVGVSSAVAGLPLLAPTLSKPTTLISSQDVDTTYHKILGNMFRCAEHVAKQDAKYTDVVLMENFHYFYVVFVYRPQTTAVLQQYITQAGESYRTHQARHVFQANFNALFDIHMSFGSIVFRKTMSFGMWSTKCLRCAYDSSNG